MNTPQTFIAALLTAAFQFGVMQHASAMDDYEDFNKHLTFIEGTEWREEGVSLPAMPVDADLIPFDVDLPGRSLNFFIDGKSVTVGNDGIVHYTLVAASTQGARNIFFEGIRCSTAEYKAYAYGGASSDGFRKMENSAWKKVSPNGLDRVRHDLHHDFVCDRYMNPNKPEVILRLLKNPADALP
jgi:hypothetical protein